MEKTEKQVAILIDGDNISSRYAKYIKDEASQYGNIKICRLYGSINSPTVKAWYKVMPGQGIMPCLQINYANGKSIADQALTIDAMDILYTGGVDIFCIVSSDSDFTKLVYRIKEFGKTVIGMGEQKTKEALAKTCDEFKILDLIYREDIGEESDEKREAEQSETEAVREFAGEQMPDEDAEELLAEEQEIKVPTEEEILEDISKILEEEDWTNLSRVGKELGKRRPGFDSRIYGYKNITLLMENHSDLFEINKEKAQDKVHNIVYARMKTEKPEKNTKGKNTRNTKNSRNTRNSRNGKK